MPNIENTLNAWTLTESITPFEIPNDYIIKKENFESDKPQKNIQRLQERKTDVWNHPLYILSEKEKAKKKQRQFGFYINIFKKYQIEQRIRKIFDVREDLINLDQTNCYGLYFQVDNKGKVMEETITVPLLMYALKYLAADSSFNADNIQNQYEENFSSFKEIVSEILVEEPLDEEKLMGIRKAYNKYFFSFKENHLHHYFSILTVGQDAELTQAFNSFYIDDLSEAKKDPNDVLRDYISGQEIEKRKDIDDNREWIEDILNPDKLPDGRWPSKVEHRLSLMQQVAVNQVASDDEQTIHSVNGPPGTGKTTLLKDIFAGLIVDRAKEMSQLKHPEDGFKKVKLHDTDRFETPLLNPKIAKYKMVVASSNNGAVENLSKELPEKEELIRLEDNPSDYDKKYSEAAKELEIFKSVSDELVGGETWGLFSGVMGKTSNINHYVESVLDTNKKDEENSKTQKIKVNNLSRQLVDDPTFNFRERWSAAKEQFHEELKIVYDLKEELTDGYYLYQEIKGNREYREELNDKISEVRKDIEKVEHEIKQLHEKSDEVNDEIDIENLQAEQQSFFQKLKDKVFGKDNEKLIELKTRNKAYKKELKDVQAQLKKAQKEISATESELQKLDSEEEEFREFEEKFKDQITIPDDAYWADTKEAYAYRQEFTPWISDDLQFHRGRLFIYAMQIHQLFLIGNYKSIQSGLFNFKNRGQLMDKDKRFVEEAWNVIHLITPMISTTFASAGRMYRGIAKDFIDYIFIDEAGQAVPQAAVGSLWRSKKAIIVGDPLQIEPVVTLDDSLLTQIRQYYNVDERLMSLSSSVQSVADEANKYGMYKEEDHWIGMPLWVHRRCANPMFDISNTLAYNNKMVLPQYVRDAEKNGESGNAGWYDVSGTAEPRQFVAEQGDKIIELLLMDWQKAQEDGKEPEVYVISPFTAVKDGIKRAVKRKLRETYSKGLVNKWVNRSIGTVHTFQGKEASKVYFVVGTDESQNGSVRWSAKTPNILNVAVTRAKDEFYIIGDRTRIGKVNYYDVIAEHTELLEDLVNTK